MVGERRRTERGGGRISLVFGALALLLAAVAVVLYVRDRNESVPEPAVPTAVAGQNEMIHVLEALEDEGLVVAFGQRGFPAGAGALSAPAQVLTAGEATLYVFVYRDDPATAAQEAAQADPATILPATTPSGTPIAGGVPHVTTKSNVIVALVGASAEVAEQVDRAIAGLP